MTKKLKEKPSFSKILNRVTGIIFVGLGLKLLTSKANN
jgi:threonine/homoserine/homoserine lactone efflux protein